MMMYESLIIKCVDYIGAYFEFFHDPIFRCFMISAYVFQILSPFNKSWVLSIQRTYVFLRNVNQ